MTEGQAGQAIAVSGIFAVLTSLFISSATRRPDAIAAALLLWLTVIDDGVGRDGGVCPEFRSVHGSDARS